MNSKKIYSGYTVAHVSVCALLLLVLVGSAGANIVEQSVVEGCPLWYDINVNETGVVGVDAWTGYSSNDVDLYLYDPSGKLIDSDTRSSDKASVTGTSSESSNGIWRVKVATPDISSMHSNIHVSSSFLLTPSLVIYINELNLNSGYSVWYEINVNETGVVGVDAWTGYSSNDVDLYLYDPSGKLIDSDTRSSDKASVTGTSSESSNGIWRVKVVTPDISLGSEKILHTIIKNPSIKASAPTPTPTPTTQPTKEIPAGWEVDYKSTRVIAEMDKNNKVHINFIGTLSNYAGSDVPEAKIDVKILNDGVIPVKPEGGGTDMKLFGTKVVYTIKPFKNGQTEDWIVRSEITDPDNVKAIDYQVKVFIMNAAGIYSNIYSTKKTIEVVLADTDGDGLSDIMESKLGTDINKPDTDGDVYSDFEETQSGSDPKDPDDVPLSTPGFVSSLAFCAVVIAAIWASYKRK